MGDGWYEKELKSCSCLPFRATNIASGNIPLIKNLKRQSLLRVQLSWNSATLHHPLLHSSLFQQLQQRGWRGMGWRRDPPNGAHGTTWTRWTMIHPQRKPWPAPPTTEPWPLELRINCRVCQRNKNVCKSKHHLKQQMNKKEICKVANDSITTKIFTPCAGGESLLFPQGSDWDQKGFLRISVHLDSQCLRVVCGDKLRISICSDLCLSDFPYSLQISPSCLIKSKAALKLSRI